MAHHLGDIELFCELSPNAVSAYRVDDDAIRMLCFSDALPTLFGITREDYRRRGAEGIANRVVPQDRALLRDTLSTGIRRCGVVDCSFRIALDDGGYRWINARSHSIDDIDGGPILLVEFRDTAQEAQIQENLLDNTDNGIYVFDAFSHELFYANRSALDYGGDRADFTGRTCHEFIRHRTRPCPWCACTETMGDFEHVELTEDPDRGNYFRIDCSRLDWHGRPAFCVSFLDVTGEELAQRVERDELERRYLEAQSYLDSVSSSYIATMRVDATSDRVEQIGGATPLVTMGAEPPTYDELISFLATAMPRLADREAFLNAFSRAMVLDAFEEGDRTISRDYLFRASPDTSATWARATMNLMCKPGSDHVIAFVTVEDIQDEMLEQQIVEHMMNSDECDFIAVIDVRNRTIDFRKLADGMTATPNLTIEDYDELVQVNALNYYPNERKRTEALAMTSIETIVGHLAGQNAYSCTLSFVDAHGFHHQKLLRYGYLDSSRDRVLAIRSDITEAYRKELADTERLQQALHDAEAADEAKSEFLSNVSHDMRTPLNAVLGYTDLAERTDDLGSVRGYLAKIRQSGKVLHRLIDDILDLNRITTGEIVLNPEPVASRAIYEEIIATVAPSIRAKGLTLVRDLDRCPMEAIVIDTMRINEVFLNLLNNAVKFTPSGGTITFTAERLSTEGRIAHDRVSVSDNGVGMSPGFLTKLFDPLTQERTARTAEVEGSGLGLSITRRLVELMGGHIEVESEPDRGTTFAVYLDFELAPAGEPTIDIGSDISAPAASLAGRKLLVVEDNPMNIEIAEMLLEREGAEVVCAENGSVGLEAFVSSRVGEYDAIIMDVRMPIMDGLEATRCIRSLERADASSVPIVAMTANAYEEDRRQCLDAGMDAHLSKPIDPDTMYRVLSEMIGTRCP